MEKKTAQVFFFMLRISFHARPVLSADGSGHRQNRDRSLTAAGLLS